MRSEHTEVLGCFLLPSLSLLCDHKEKKWDQDTENFCWQRWEELEWHYGDTVCSPSKRTERINVGFSVLIDCWTGPPSGGNSLLALTCVEGSYLSTTVLLSHQQHNDIQCLCSCTIIYWTYKCSKFKPQREIQWCSAKPTFKSVQQLTFLQI